MNKMYCLIDETGVVHFPGSPGDLIGLVACGKDFGGLGSMPNLPERISICFECYRFHHGKDPNDSIQGEYAPRDKYLVCLCPRFEYPDNWLSHDLWGARYNDDFAPVPPSCVHCGAWPRWWDRVCGRCEKRFYLYFLHPNQRYFPNELCWDCCKIADPSPDYRYWGERVKKVAPHPDLLPKIRTLAEIREALRKL